MTMKRQKTGPSFKIIMGEGDGAKVGDTIAIFGESGEDFADLLAEIEAQASASPAPAATVEEPAPAAVPSSAPGFSNSSYFTITHGGRAISYWRKSQSQPSG
jgi:pyruvate/2-oxoglutarate dehydrogenase complex dihydrolipoamide acyltransferase (E2) component